VLDHVHRERLVGQPVDGRDQRDEQRQQPAEERDEAPGRRLAAPAQPALRAHAPPAGHVDAAEGADEHDRSRLERPRSVRCHCAEVWQRCEDT
jgi:hypothetical protein